MKKFITCLLLGALLGMIPPPLPAQQNQNQEMEALKKRVSELEKQLQTMENIEKLDLLKNYTDAQAKLADANAKLANAKFDEFERELRDSNDKWLRGWSSWFVGIIGFFVVVIAGVGAIFWFWLKSTANQLIANEVEKNLNGFKESVDRVDVMQNELKVLKKEHAASVLERFSRYYFEDEHSYPEEIKALPEDDLLQVFSDKERYELEVRHKAAEVLANRKSPRLVSPLLEFLNSVVDSGSDFDYDTETHLRRCVTLLVKIPTPETHQGLAEFLNRLLTENPKHEEVFLTWSALSLAAVSVELNKRDSVPILRRTISDLDPHQVPAPIDLLLQDFDRSNALSDLAEYFDIFNEPEGIKEILTNHVTSEASGMEDVEARCLELLQKHAPEFVEQWRASETTENNA